MKNQKGAVSIFIVVFTALLVTIVTTSFVQVMLRNQQQASNNDLSQSAFDSALAGVEDAKRALVRFKECRLTPLVDTCPSILSAITAENQQCNMLQVIGATFSNGERRVGDVNANQAYTCVKIDVTSGSYEGVLESEDDQALIPLDTVGPASAIGSIRVSWFNRCDMSGTPDPTNPSACTLPVGSTPNLPAAPAGALPRVSDWPANRPPILRAQLIQYNGSLSLSDFDADGTDMANTLFVYPKSTPGSINNEVHFNDDLRRQGAGESTLQEVRCSTSFGGSIDGYLCSARLIMPSTPMPDKQAYLHVASIYNKAHFKVELCRTTTCSAGDIIDFDSVQPRVDSTGRASNLFRRLEAKIFLAPTGPKLEFPSAALSLRNSFCKDMFVTNVGSERMADSDGVLCDPTN